MLQELDDSNKRRVLDKNGEYVTTMSFEESFEHHVDYVWCRAKGQVGSLLGRKPEFCAYIRGAPLCKRAPPS